LCFIFFIVNLDVVKILKALTFATRELYNFMDWKELCAKFDTVVWYRSIWETHKVQYLLRRFWQNNYASKPGLPCNFIECSSLLKAKHWTILDAKLILYIYNINFNIYIYITLTNFKLTSLDYHVCWWLKK